MSNRPPTPLQVPPGIAHVVLFGGTFDPPHLAHTTLSDRARCAFEQRVGGDAMLVFVPAARSPHKADTPTASDDQRIDMLRLATAELPNSTVWTDEIDRATAGEPSYWLNTLRRARTCIGQRTLAFIIGADQAAQFHRWQSPRTMLELARPLLLPRSPITTSASLRSAMAESGFWKNAELDSWAVSFIETDTVHGASTEVRMAAGVRQDTPMHPDVEAYAKQQGLYGL